MKTYEISGLKCQGCVNTVTEKLSKTLGVKSVSVDLNQKLVSVEGKTPKFLLNAALKGTKFELGKEV